MEGAEQRLHLHKLWEGSKYTPQAAKSSLPLSSLCVWPVECVDPLLQPEILPSLQSPAWVWTLEGPLRQCYKVSPVGLLSPCVIITKAHWSGCGAAVQFPHVQRDRQISVLFFWKYLSSVTGPC